jgi:hypothetical protein
MDGSTASVIVIPIVIVISLAAWLIVVAWAASHPDWRGRNQASGQRNPGQAGPDASPAAPADPALAAPDVSQAAPAVPVLDRDHVHQKAA